MSDLNTMESQNSDSCEISTAIVEDDDLRNQPFIVPETKIIYDMALPLLFKSGVSRGEWFDDLLNMKRRNVSVIFKNTDKRNGYIIVPHQRWNERNLTLLHCIALCKTKEASTLRDLRQHHIPLLRNIHHTGVTHISQRYHVEESELISYVHYHPTDYRLHIHFIHKENPGRKTHPAKAHPLNVVISNIESDTTHYRDAVIPVLIRKNPTLYDAYKDAGFDFSSINVATREELLQRIVSGK